METVSKLPYPTPTRIQRVLFRFPVDLGRRFARCHQSVDDFQRRRLGSQFCGGQRAAAARAAAASPGRNQNLCLDRRLTIAICHKLT